MKNFIFITSFIFFLFVGLSTANAQFTINSGQQFQIMNGFGGISEGMGDMPQTTVNILYNQWPNGIGLTFDRTALSTSASCGAPYPQGPYPLNSDGSFQAGDWVNEQRIVAAGGTIWASSNGGCPSMKSSGTLDGGEISNISAYANLMVQFAQIAASKGINFYGMTPMNEPDQNPTGFQSMTVNSTNMVAIVKALRPILSSSIKIIVPEAATQSTAWNPYILAVNSDTVALADTDLFSMHSYGSPVVPPSGQFTHPVWGTEWQDNSNNPNDQSIGSALNMVNALAGEILVGQASEWTALFLGYQGNPVGSCTQASGTRLLCLNADWSLNTKLPTYYAMGNFSAFVRSGFIRIGTSGSLSGVTLLAFINPSNNAPVLVAINNGGNVNASFSGVNVSQLTPYITSGSQSLQQQAIVSISGGNFSYNLPGSSITTFAAASGTPPTPTPTPQPTPTNGGTYLIGS